MAQEIPKRATMHAHYNLRELVTHSGSHVGENGHAHDRFRLPIPHE
jgi:hypothetical protein